MCIVAPPPRFFGGEIPHKNCPTPYTFHSHAVIPRLLRAYLTLDNGHLQAVTLGNARLKKNAQWSRSG